MVYGRPLKGQTRRTPITVHAPLGTLEIIDNYVREFAETSETAYSRSDFYQEAAEAFLRERGIDPETGERNKSVTKNEAVGTNENNGDK